MIELGRNLSLVQLLEVVSNCKVLLRIGLPYEAIDKEKII